MLNIIIAGAPGSGKGTQSKLIAGKYGLMHLSSGELLRREIAADTETGRLADSLITEGNFVPNDLIINLLCAKIDASLETAGFIFDGFPRNVVQAEALDRLLAERSQSVSLMVDLQVDESALIERLLQRGETSGRSDDQLITITKRLALYHQETAPILDFYQKSGRLHRIENNSSVEACFRRMTALINSTIFKTN
jgi:adenylate kinase